MLFQIVRGIQAHHSGRRFPGYSRRPSRYREPRRSSSYTGGDHSKGAFRRCPVQDVRTPRVVDHALLRCLALFLLALDRSEEHALESPEVLVDMYMMTRCNSVQDLRNLATD